MDTLLPAPSLMTVNGDVLYVFDQSKPALVGLDMSSGVGLWSAGKRGRGPEEFSGASQLVPMSGGGIGVVDPRNRRILHLDAHGQPLGLIPLGAIGQQPNQACGHGSGRMVVADVFNPLMLVIDTGGALRDRLPALWPDLLGAGVWSRQAMLRGDSGGTRCLVALFTGRGFAIVQATGSPILAPYIERFEVTGVGPRREEQEVEVVAAVDGEFQGDTVYVLFAGESRMEYRLLDRYSVADGEYVGSLRLPFPTSEIAVGGGMVFAFLEGDSVGTRIIALRPRS